MKTIAIVLAAALLASCTCTFRGSFLNVDEFHFGPIPHEKAAPNAP